MSRFRIVLVPSLTELEWAIRPLIEEWAEVASFDAPGVGDEPPHEGNMLEASARRGLAELDRRRWDRCVIVGDEYGAGVAARMAASRPAAVQALVLGHACLRFRREGERPSLSPDVSGLLLRLADLDFRAFARQMFTGWDPGRGAMGEPARHADVADRYLERVEPDAARTYLQAILSEETSTDPSLEERLRGLDAPLLFVRHEGCLLFTPEGFDDAVAAVPRARTASTTVKPSVSPEFATILRDFCEAAVSDPTDPIRRE
jgi:pimeloyl-ACP methyl ester carboxylesterase